MGLCLHPVQSPGGLRPCGRCPVCRSRNREQWSARMYLEKSVSPSTWFVTFTYEDTYLPHSEYGENPSVSHKDITTTLRAIKDYCDYHLQSSVRFVACSEYGETYLRPHYHAVLFFSKSITKATCEKICKRFWPYGFITVSIAYLQRLQYVSKYVLKEDSENTHKYLEPEMNVFRSFTRHPAIGCTSECIDYLAKYIWNDGVNFRFNIPFGGHKVGLPRVILEKLPLKVQLAYQHNQATDEYQERLREQVRIYSRFYIDPISGKEVRVNDYSKDREILKFRKFQRHLRKSIH